MIKALLQGKMGHQMLLLGLSEENVKQLRDGQPIAIRPAQIEQEDFKDIDGILLAYSPTDKQLEDDLQRLLTSKGWRPIIQRTRDIT